MPATRVTGATAGAPASAKTRSWTNTILRTSSMWPFASAIQPREQAGGVPAAAAHFLHLGVELIDQRRDRQVRAIAPSLGDADRQVLAHPVDGEAEVVFAGHHGLVAVLHLPGLRCALGDGGNQGFDVEAGLFGKVDAFGE